MGQILIRKLEDDVLEGLRARARANNRSVEAEARAIIGSAVLPPERPRRTLMSFVGLHPTGRTMDEIVADVRALRDEWPE
jgi:plasmid stability protein